MRTASPPSLLSKQRPQLSSTLLELVSLRLQTASSQPINNTLADDEHGGNAGPMSEQTVLLLALIDSLPFLQLEALEDWLSIAARSLHMVEDPILRHACRNRFWEVLTNGEMDVERAAVCATWWSSRGGRQMVLYGKDDDAEAEPLMSGALRETSKL